ncbi:Biotin-requiring enzyme [Alteribacillus persepolensis]|uniref:Biotin-requiring enzyme n=1 Tax=Alteribacillus persepolensis TaxID=568899 RepID=A0A1G8F521_9BACI|nr:biotin/lipoyl-containing protein [Alteribacillus persepolensis]SDH77099.1 Biotin-requiring enzyme [Alteribacillus persepolensis]
MFQKIHEVSSFEQGKIAEVYVKPLEYVYEWEPLFTIQTENGSLAKVHVGASGIIKDIHVTAGETIKADTVLAVIEDDLKLSGSD